MLIESIVTHLKDGRYYVIRPIEARALSPEQVAALVEKLAANDNPEIAPKIEQKIAIA